jgi:hypothetical protein
MFDVTQCLLDKGTWHRKGRPSAKFFHRRDAANKPVAITRAFSMEWFSFSVRGLNVRKNRESAGC